MSFCHGLLKNHSFLILQRKRVDEMPRLSELTKEEWAAHNTTIWNCASANGYFASFDEEIPTRLIKYFTFRGDTVFDPFMGSGTTLVVAKRLGRNAYGVDCSKKATEFTLRKLGDIPDRLVIKPIRGDSRNLSDFRDNMFDFLITSPPYFDIVHYSDEKEQLGNIHNYDEFLKNVIQVFKEGHRVLKPQKYLSIITSDIRKAKVYYPIHVDYINQLQKIGFRLHQILINVFKTSGLGKRENCMGYPSNFHPWMVREYILIFQKMGVEE